MAPASSPSALATSMRRRSRSKGGVGAFAVLVAGLAVVLGALSTFDDIAFAVGAPAPTKPAAPKRPGSGYILWSSSRRPALVKEMPDKKVPDLGKALGAEWKALSDGEKAQWSAKATGLLETYKQKVADWTSQYGPIPKKQKKVTKAPPRPGSSYNFFVKAKAKATMAELGTKNATEAAAKLGSMWKQMTDAQKAPYVQEAAAAKVAFEASRPPKAAPKPGGPYTFFVKAKAKATMAELGTKKVTEAAAKLARMWKEMTDAQKAPYVQESAAAKEAYATAHPPVPVAKKVSPPKGKAKTKAKAPVKAKGKGKVKASPTKVATPRAKKA